ncbi:MAG: TolC family protein [Desulfuromonas sp.]|nr:MAG: TolC family protein [Desulfuromonas sp.]
MCRFTHLMVFSALIVAVLAAPEAVHADTTGQVVTTSKEVLSLQDVLQRIGNSPAFTAAEKAIEAAEGNLEQAGLWPNPELSIEVENFGGKDDLEGFDGAETTVVIAQTLEIGGKRGARKAIASQGHSLAKWDKLATEQDLRLEAMKAFYATLAAQMRLEQAKQLVSLAEQAYQTVADRVEAGKVSPVQQLRASVELNSSRSAAETAERQLVQARQELCAKWGDSKPNFKTVVGNFEELSDLPEWETLQASFPGNPDVRRWEAELDNKNASLELERANSIPDVTLSFGVRKYEDTGDNAYVAGLEIPLPLFDRNQGGRKSAQAEISQTVFTRDATLASLSSELQSAFQELQATHYQARTLQRDIMPAAEQANAAAQIGYQEGKFDFLEALDAQRTLFDVKAQYVDAFSAYHEARLNVMRLAGQIDQKEQIQPQ